MVPLLTKVLLSLAGALSLAALISLGRTDATIGFIGMAGILVVAARISQAHDHFQQWQDSCRLNHRLRENADAGDNYVQRTPQHPWHH